MFLEVPNGTVVTAQQQLKMDEHSFILSA